MAKCAGGLWLALNDATGYQYPMTPLTLITANCQHAQTMKGKQYFS